VDRAEAEAIYDAGRGAVVEVLLELSAQNERLVGQVEGLTAQVARQEERIVQLERRLGRNSRNSSLPPSSDPPGASPPRREKDSLGRGQGAQPGHEGKGRELLPTAVVDEVIEHWPQRCGCGHVFAAGELVGVGAPVRLAGRGVAAAVGAADRAPGPAGALSGLWPTDAR
jgi:transposase